MTENISSREEIMKKVMETYQKLPNVFYSDSNIRYDRRLDLAFFSVFLDSEGDDEVLKCWSETTQTEIDWSIDRKFEIDRMGNWYHPQITLFYIFLPGFYHYKGKKFLKRIISIHKNIYQEFLLHLKKLEMRKVRLTVEDYNKLLHTPIFPFYMRGLDEKIKKNMLLTPTDEELFIFRIFEKEKRPLTSTEIHELIVNGKYQYEKDLPIHRITKIKKNLITKGLAWRQRFAVSAFKLKTIRMDFYEPILVLTKWHNNPIITSKATHVYIKIPESFNEDDILGIHYRNYDTLDGGMGFVFRHPEFGWEINRKKLFNELSKIEYIRDKNPIRVNYIEPIQDLTFEHFLVGFYLELMPSASERDLIKITGIYRQKIKAIIETLKTKIIYPPQPFFRRFDLPNMVILTIKSYETGIFNLLRDIGKLFPIYVLYRTYDVHDHEFNLILYLPQNSVGITLYCLRKFFQKLKINIEIEIVKYNKFNNYLNIRDYFDPELRNWIFDPEKQFRIIRYA
ncbi:MAG: hypothetical protein ACTSRP_05945 [Candidatus Helarchaeota archaeon]